MGFHFLRFVMNSIKKLLPRKAKPAPVFCVLSVTRLEDRITPVVDGTVIDINPAPFDGNSFDGVVMIKFRNPNTGVYQFEGSGFLFEERNPSAGVLGPPPESGQGFGHHILTAAHVIETGGAIGILDRQVNFEVYRGAAKVTIPIFIPANTANEKYQIGHPDYVNVPNYTQLNDIAILKLVDQVSRSPDRLMVSPFLPTGIYGLYKGTGEVGQTVEFSGFGRDGTGNTGQAGPETAQIKRAGVNFIDMTGSSARNELQKVTFTGTPGSTGNPGSYFQIVAGGLSNLIYEGADAAEFQRELESIGALSGNVEVRMPSPGHWYISFVNGLANQDEVQIGIVGGGLLRADTILEGNPGVGPDSTTLWMDFDNTSSANDAFSAYFGLPGLAVPSASEASIAEGDSGGPVFIGNGLVGGVISSGGSLTGIPGIDSPPDFDSAKDNFTFGESFQATRISSFVASFIDPVVHPLDPVDCSDVKYHAVLDMNFQVLGLSNPGEDVTIRATRNGANLELWVTESGGQFSGLYYSAPAANISSLTIRGSDDNETIILDGNLGVGPIQITPRGGVNVVNIGNPATGGNLADVSAPITVTGAAVGQTALEVYDANATGNRAYSITNALVRRNDRPAINYQDVNSIQLVTGTGSDTVSVASTEGGALLVGSLGVPLTIVNSGGNDVITVDNVGQLGGVNSQVFARAMGGTNQINVDASQLPNAQQFFAQPPAGFIGTIDMQTLLALQR